MHRQPVQLSAISLAVRRVRPPVRGRAEGPRHRTDRDRRGGAGRDRDRATGQGGVGEGLSVVRGERAVEGHGAGAGGGVGDRHVVGEALVGHRGADEGVAHVHGRVHAQKRRTEDPLRHRLRPVGGVGNQVLARRRLQRVAALHVHADRVRRAGSRESGDVEVGRGVRGRLGGDDPPVDRQGRLVVHRAELDPRRLRLPRVRHRDGARVRRLGHVGEALLVPATTGHGDRRGRTARRSEAPPAGQIDRPDRGVARRDTVHVRHRRCGTSRRDRGGHPRGGEHHREDGRHQCSCHARAPSPGLEFSWRRKSASIPSRLQRSDPRSGTAARTRT